VKTNRSGIFGETALQLAAYRYADVLIPQGPEQPMPEVDACFAIHVRGDGAPSSRSPPTSSSTGQFLYAQQVAEFVDVSSDLVGPAVEPPSMSTFRLVREQTA
jgi:hypothetical protein